MLSAYKSGFYPGVVRYAEDILRREKDSLAAFRASVYEGESLFKMGRPEDAVEIMRKYQMNGDSMNPETIQLNAAKFYWLGRCFFVQRKFDIAQKCFFASASVFGEYKKALGEASDSSLDYYSLSMLHGGKCYIETKNYGASIPLYEYVISNGTKYLFDDYRDAVLSLAQSYNITADKANAKKCVSLTASLESVPFDEETRYSLMILKGEAYETLGEYKLSYETYCYVIRNAPAFLAASAMQKAYAVSSSHKSEVGSEAGEVLSRAEYRLSEFPDLLSEFWTRLAVDAFNAGDYKKSLSYFKEAQSNASSSQTEISAIYRAEIAYITESDKKAGAENALKILAEAALTKSGAKNEIILLSIARYNGYLKKWKECELYSSKCLKSEEAELALNAVYWNALAKYESGNIQGAIEAVDTYKRTNELEDKSLLNLYAKALAKQGKYHDADVIFYSLGEKNQLDNDGRLDYSRTLLIAGHYISTKQQAAKAEGDEAVYLSALASFNQHRWQEAEKSFAKIISSKELHKDYVAYGMFYLGYAQYQLGEYGKSVSTLNKFIEENPLHVFVWSANMTIARGAAFTQNGAEAISASQRAIKTARNEKDRHEAIILSAGILSDNGEFGEALSLLAPYLSEKSSFGYESMYKSAEILVRQGKLGEADLYFGKLSRVTDPAGKLISEESAYRRAEIAYSQEEYADAAVYFEFYNKKWPDGRFSFAATYFSADCLAKSGDDIKAILRYEQITDSKSETSYRYGAEKNLIDLYQKIGDYVSALAMAQRMIKDYSTQALNDGIGKKIDELKKLGAGSALSLDDKVRLAEKDLEKHKNDEFWAKDNMNKAIFLAESYRLKRENKKSALMFIEAVKYSSAKDDADTIARCLYGAVESFDAAGLYGDAKGVFKEMQARYKDNKYTKKAEKIAGEL